MTQAENEGVRAPITGEDLLPALIECANEVFGMMLSSVATLVHKSGPAADVPVEEKLEDKVAFEATVAFHGCPSGAVLLRCTADGALDIARGLLMLDEGEEIEAEEVKDALGECANMLSGSLKSKVLDPNGEYTLGTPQIDAVVNPGPGEHQGSLIYRMESGSTALEVWTDESTCHL